VIVNAVLMGAGLLTAVMAMVGGNFGRRAVMAH
jgi:hypothetical protein